MGTHLHVDGVTIRYGDRAVLHDISLSIESGESVAIMGRSGSGKSTLLHAITGVLLPDAGRVLFDAGGGPVDVTALTDAERSALRLRRFGFVFQQGMLLPELTAVENVALPLLLGGGKRVGALAGARRQIQSVGLADLGERRPGQLSGGEAQRVAIARAIVANPQIVFGDEPTASLDDDTAEVIVRELLRATTGEGRSLVVVTHDSAVAARCDRTIHLHEGRIGRASAA